MSIDARIAGISVIKPTHCPTCDGTGEDPADSWEPCPACHGGTAEHPVVRLLLEPRERAEVAGQRALTLVNPPTTDPQALAGLIGIDIWGNSSSIMVGEKRWAKRIGYGRIELVAVTT